MKHIVLLAGIFFVSSGVLFWQGWQTRQRDSAYLKNTIETTGTVVGYQTVSTDPDQPGSIDFQPTIVYTTRDGQEVTGQSVLGNRKQVFAIGQRVTVVYDPKTPERVDPKDWLVSSVRWPLGWILGLIMIGGSFAFVGVSLLAKKIIPIVSGEA